MIRFEEKKLMKDVTPAELSKAEAKKLTRKIKTAVDELWTLLVKAREGKAWKALGYSTWEAYVKAEFGMSRSRSYQLLEKGEVVEALQKATGDLSNALDISARDVDAVKTDLPAVTEEIRTRVENGEEPATAVAEIVDARREEQEKIKADKASRKAERKARQEENERQRQEYADKLPDHIKAVEAAKDAARQAKKDKTADDDAGLTDADRIAELEEAVRALEAENAELKARIAEDEELDRMRAEWRGGGWDQVIEKLKADHAELVRLKDGRIEAESTDKVRWMNSARHWQKEAKKLGYGDDDIIRVASVEASDG